MPTLSQTVMATGCQGPEGPCRLNPEAKQRQTHGSPRVVHGAAQFLCVSYTRIAISWYCHLARSMTASMHLKQPQGRGIIPAVDSVKLVFLPAGAGDTAMTRTDIAAHGLCASQGLKRTFFNWQLSLIIPFRWWSLQQQAYRKVECVTVL